METLTSILPSLAIAARVLQPSAQRMPKAVEKRVLRPAAANCHHHSPANRSLKGKFWGLAFDIPRLLTTHMTSLSLVVVWPRLLIPHVLLRFIDFDSPPSQFLNSAAIWLHRNGASIQNYERSAAQWSLWRSHILHFLTTMLHA